MTGGGGFLGSCVVKKLAERGVVPHNIFIPRSTEYDLRKWENCLEVAEIFYDNLIMGSQLMLMEAIRMADVQKFVAIA